MFGCGKPDEMAKAVAIVLVMLISTETSYGIRDKQMTSNVTQTLDFLLASNRYDKRLRPGFGGEPITVSVNFLIKSMGPVSDNDQSFGLDCYFRQHWYDLRLQYHKLPGLEELSMSWLFLDRVWKPDTYFVNGKRSYLHRITVPNKFLRLRYDGYITYSMRLTVTATCPMYLRKFPLDAQRCPLILGSYGYTNKDLIYKWSDESPIGLQQGVEIAQFDLVNITTENEKTLLRGGLSYSTVQANFWLKRHTGYFMLQVYVPCGLIVLSSWVSFWIDPDDVAARVALGVTTVLSLTTMGFGGRAQLPKVSYWTALDWFVIICFTSVFSVMIEYAIVNFIDKFTKDLKKVIQNEKKEEEKIKNTFDGKDIDIEAKPDRIKLKMPYKRKRSASLPLVISKSEHEDVGDSENIRHKAIIETNVPFDEEISEMLSDDSTKFQWKLSTTLLSYPKSPRKRSKSIPNLTSEVTDYLEEETSKHKIIISDIDEDLIDLNKEVEPLEVVLELDGLDLQEKQMEDSQEKESACVNFLKNISCLKNFRDKINILPRKVDLITMIESPEPPNKFSRIDVQSRRNFPIAFLISLIIYLFAFSYYLTDDLPIRDPELYLYKQ